MTLSLPAAKTTDPSNLTVEHYDVASDEWVVLETEVVSTGERVVLQTESDGFSLFAVTEYQETASSTATQTPTETASVSTQTTTTASGDTPTATREASPSDEEQAGFGPILALLALTIASLLAARRHAR